MSAAAAADPDVLRRQVGRAAALWAPGAGTGGVPGRWSALSGADAVDYNVVCCHGAAGAAQVPSALAQIRDAGVKAIVMLAGVGEQAREPLRAAGWTMVADSPLMRCEIAGSPLTRRAVADSPPTRRAVAGAAQPADGVTCSWAHLAAARGLVARAFGLPPELAAAALPDTATEAPDQLLVSVFQDGAMACCVAGVVVDETVVAWSLATDPDRRRRGLGGRAMAGLLHAAAARGATRSAHIASPDGERLYTALGYELVERWELWSRRRWTMGAR